MISQKRSSEQAQRRDSIERQIQQEPHSANDVYAKKAKYEMLGSLSGIDEKSHDGATSYGTEIDMKSPANVGALEFSNRLLKRSNESRAGRLSVYDLSRKTKNQGGGSYHATNYDKSPILKQAFQKHVKKAEEDSLLSELLTCLFAEVPIRNLHSDYEMMEGYSWFKQAY